MSASNNADSLAPQDVDAASPNAETTAKPTKPKRPLWRKKRFQIPFFLFVVCPAILAVAVKLLYFNGVKLKPSPETTGFVEPLDKHGNVDFIRIYEEKQATGLGAPENGFRQIAQAFGPVAFNKREFAQSNRWDVVASSFETREWFEKEWTPICEKLNLDPAARPPFVNRLDLTNYIQLNGVSGTEPDGDPDDVHNLVWVDYLQTPGRVDLDAAADCVDAVSRFPWTAEAFPVAARWLEENADVYAVYESAINAPRYEVPRWLPFDETQAAQENVAALAYAYQIAQNLAVRANFRIGNGDVDGAIEDRRLIFLLARRLFDNPLAVLQDNAFALRVYETGVSIRIGANPNAPPTPEQWARAAEIHRETLGEYDFDAAWRRAYEAERFIFVATTSSLLSAPASESQNPDVRALRLILQGLDANFVMQELNKLFPPSQNGAIPQSEPGDDALSPELQRFIDGNNELHYAPLITRVFSPNRKKRAEALILGHFGMCDVVYQVDFLWYLPPFHMTRRIFDQAENLSRLQTLQLAALRSQAENGALPPAFSVDAEGRPLHSWRVLILPYLNDECKALYEQIRLDEPWNSPHNSQFHAQAPSVFCRAHDRTASPELAAFSVIVGPQSLYSDNGVGLNLSELARDEKPSALSQALIVERKTPVNWMQPDAEILETTALEDGINGCARQLPGPPSPNGIGSSLGSAPRNDDYHYSIASYDNKALIATADGAVFSLDGSTTKRYEATYENFAPLANDAEKLEGYTLDELIIGVKPL